MAVKREKSEGYEVKGTGELVQVNSEGMTFRDSKTGDNMIAFSEIIALIGKEVTFSVKIVDKKLV